MRNSLYRSAGHLSIVIYFTCGIGKAIRTSVCEGRGQIYWIYQKRDGEKMRKKRFKDREIYQGQMRLKQRRLIKAQKRLIKRGIDQRAEEIDMKRD